MINEHRNSANSHIKYTTSNYNLTCTPQEELEAVLCPEPGKTYPGTSEGGRKLPPLRVFLSAAGCLEGYTPNVTEVGDEKAGDQDVGHDQGSNDTELNGGKFASVLRELEKTCGALTLSEEDKVDEALCLLMMARPGFSTTVARVQERMQAKVQGGDIMNMELFFECMQAEKKDWTKTLTQRVIETGRERFKLAALRPEEVLGIRLYTGPQFMHYNCVLRKFPVQLVESLEGNTYPTTIHCINSAIIKLSRACPLDPRIVARGSKGLRLPRQFAVKDALGCQGDVEMGFISTTSDLDVACNYAAGGVMAMVLMIERGAMDKGASIGSLSQYPKEEEILFPPLCNLEVCFFLRCPPRSQRELSLEPLAGWLLAKEWRCFCRRDISQPEAAGASAGDV